MVGDARQVLHHLLGGLPGEVSRHGQSRDHEQRQERKSLRALVPAEVPVQQEGESQRNSHDGNVIQDQVEMGVAARMAVLTSLAARLDND